MWETILKNLCVKIMKREMRMHLSTLSDKQYVTALIGDLWTLKCAEGPWKTWLSNAITSVTRLDYWDD